MWAVESEAEPSAGPGGRTAGSKRRPYDATSRQDSARHTQARVVDAARQLMLRDGYSATTIKAIAALAGVSQETIFKSFGSKKAIAKRLYDVTVAGDGEEIPLGRRERIQQALAADSIDAALGYYACFVAEFHHRASPLRSLLADADAEIADLRTRTERERLHGVTAFVGELARRGLIPPSSADAPTADSLWVVTSPAVFDQLVGARGWSLGQYRLWLQQMMAASIAGEPPPEGEGGLAAA
jgi:AcrR family transcriptional regulator